MKSLSVILCLLISSSLMAQEKKKDKSYYIKKNGKYYKVKKVKKTKKKKSSVPAMVTSTKDSRITSPKDNAENNVLVSLGFALNSVSDEDNNTSSSSSNNNNNSNSSYGFELEGGYKFQLSDRVNLTPGIFARRISMTENAKDSLTALSEVTSVESVRTFEVGANANIGYDFLIDGGMILRPMGILGYSRGNVKTEAVFFNNIDVEAKVNYSRVQYGLGLQLEMSNGLAPFGKFLFSTVDLDNTGEVTATNTSTGQTVNDNNVAINSDDDDSDRTLVLGLGYWF